MLNKPFTQEQKSTPSVYSGFANVAIGFSSINGQIQMLRTYENLWCLPKEKHDKYNEVISRYAKENLKRLIHAHKLNIEEMKPYCLGITFTADLIENLWNVSDWVLWESETEETAPVIIDRWQRPEQSPIVELQRVPPAKYPELEMAMRYNPRIVMRTSTVLYQGKMQFLTLCANNCRPYIADHHRIRVTDDYMWSIEKQTVDHIIGALENKYADTGRLAWGVSESMEESIQICSEKANRIWKKVNATKKAQYEAMA